MKTAAVALVVTLSAASAASAQIESRSTYGKPMSAPMLSSLPWSTGIQPLTASTLAEAVNLGQQTKQAAPLTSLLAVRALRLNDPDRMVRDGERQALTNTLSRGPFTLELVTPFIAVHNAAAEAERRFQTFAAPTVEAANAEKVWVVVAPGPEPRTAASVDNVVLRRGDAIIRPLQSKVEPQAPVGAATASKPLNAGRFQFPIEAFAPDKPVTIVIVGATENFEWTIETAELKKLR